MKRALTIITNLLVVSCLGAFALSALVFEMAPSQPDAVNTDRVVQKYSLQERYDTRYMSIAKRQAYEVAGTTYVWSLVLLIGCSVTLFVLARKAR